MQDDAGRILAALALDKAALVCTQANVQGLCLLRRCQRAAAPLVLCCRRQHCHVLSWVAKTAQFARPASCTRQVCSLQPPGPLCREQ